MKSKNPWLFGSVAFTLLFVASAVLFRVFDVEILPSQFFGALIGVVITAIITVFLLKGQSESEMQRDKDVRVFEEKIQVYSEFTDKMWAMLDDGVVTSEELKDLRKICFRRLVFYLNSNQVKEIYKQIISIDFENDDTAAEAIAEITCILQKSLNTDEYVEPGSLRNLFNSFKKEEKLEDSNQSEESKTIDTQFWHFNILHEQHQIQAFKDGNWSLALIEYGESWRTNLVRQVKPNDIIFLFKRGGSGYIGAFRALDPTSKILEGNNQYAEAEIAKYDIYGGLSDGASLCSNLLVEPIAFNFKGVGYYSVRRRTIERMNDSNAVKFLLNRFNGNDLDANRLEGKGKLDNETSLALNRDYFEKIMQNYNL